MEARTAEALAIRTQDADRHTEKCYFFTAAGAAAGAGLATAGATAGTAAGATGAAAAGVAGATTAAAGGNATYGPGLTHGGTSVAGLALPLLFK